MSVAVQRRADDTAELRATILADMVKRFALDPSPKRGMDVYCEAVRAAGGDGDLCGPIVKTAIILLVHGGVLSCNRIDPWTGMAVFDDETVLRGGDRLECHMVFMMDDPSNFPARH